MDYVTEPWAHQRKTVNHIIDNDIDYYAFFWDMGTGKTKAGVDVIRSKYQKHKRFLKTLIICPSAVQDNWAREIVTHSHIKKEVIQVVDGTTKPDGKKLKSPSKKLKIEQINDPTKEIFIITLGTVKNFLRKVSKRERLLSPWGHLEQLGFELLLIDEVHNFKDVRGTRTKGLMRFVNEQKKLRYRFIFTGTPILQDALDLWPQFYILNKNIFNDNFSTFRAKYFYDENASWGSNENHFAKWKPKDKEYFESLGAYSPEQDPMTLDKIIYQHANRVMKTDVLDLPERTYQTLTCEMGKDQKKMYDSFKKSLVVMLNSGDTVLKNELLDALDSDELKEMLPDVMSADLAIVKAIRLMQLANGIFTNDDGKITLFETPKFKLLREQIELQSQNYENKFIIWSVFKPTYAQISDMLKELGIKHVFINGDMNKDEKQAANDAFQKDPEVRAVIANQGAGGTGINLTSANFEYKYSRNFKLGDQLQSDSRANRGGQLRKTTCVDLVVKDTIEVACVQRLKEKEKDAENILKTNGEFTRDEILEMV